LPNEVPIVTGLATSVDPDDARNSARQILSNGRFHVAHTPRPLRKPLSWLGDRLHGIADWFGRVFSHIPTLLTLALGLLVVAVAIAYVVTKVRARRGSPDGRRRAPAVAAAGSEDPVELELAADAAERAGQLDVALRLRFRAGLLRLGARGAIRYRPSVTTNEVRRVLGSQSFDELARTFDAVAYGGRDAAPPDLDTARRDWPRVVASASPSRDSRATDPSS
jgi:Domain of unknown function (DUF4129)